MIKLCGKNGVQVNVNVDGIAGIIAASSDKDRFAVLYEMFCDWNGIETVALKMAKSLDKDAKSFEKNAKSCNPKDIYHYKHLARMYKARANAWREIYIAYKDYEDESETEKAEQ